MTLNYVTIAELASDGSAASLNGAAIFTPNQAVYSASSGLLVPDVPVEAQIVNGQLKTLSGAPLQLLATDNASLTFLTLTGYLEWTVQVTVSGVEQAPWSFFLPSSPSSRDLYSLANTGIVSGLYVQKSGDTMTGALSVPDLAVQGLTGATAASRYAGATASGAPVSGTFAAGDFVADQTGTFWVCVTAGTPGTWVRLVPVTGATMTGWLAPKVVPLTDAATIAVNASLGNDFRVTLGGNRTMATPSNPADGQKITFEVIQGAGGSFTLTWASGAGGYDFGTSGAPNLSTAAGAIDQVAFRYSNSKGGWLCLGSATGF